MRHIADKVPLHPRTMLDSRIAELFNRIGRKAPSLTFPVSSVGGIVINFQPTGGGKAAITGDFVLVAQEVNPVLKALREGGIEVTALHSHMLTEQPRLFFMNFWAVDVRKLRPVEVEADRFLRPGARAVDPDEAGIAIDEAADQPGAGHAIHPEVLPRRPYAVLVGLSVERPEMPKRGARLTARILDAALEGGKRLGGLSLPIARQEIPRGKPLKRASQSFERAGGGGGSELFEQRSVVRAAVEQSAHLLELFRALRLQLDDHGRSAGGVDL